MLKKNGESPIIFQRYRLKKTTFDLTCNLTCYIDFVIPGLTLECDLTFVILEPSKSDVSVLNRTFK
jgi:hypothetical protein